MADKEGGFGQNVLGKLKLVGGKVVDFGGSVAGKVVDVSGTVGTRIVDIGGTLGNKIVDVTKTTTQGLFESDFERLRHLNEVAKQQQDLRKKYTEQELAAVEARADLVLGQLYPGYFEANFDPVAYELSRLHESDNQDQIDELVERLTQGVETVSGRLSRHVNKKRDVLLAGIDRVAEVEDDLKAAFLITRSSRTTLKAAAEEVTRNIRVVGQTRRKQSYMELMEVVVKIKRARDLQLTLKKVQELGEYGDAIIKCVQCFQGVDTLSKLSVSGDLRTSVQRQYVDTLRRMDGALTNICAEFDPDKYTKLLEGYMLQGMDGKALAEKVLQCFKSSIHDVTTRVVRSLMLTKPKLAERLANARVQVPWADLCRALPVDLLRPCLLRLLEVVFDVLASYHVMAYWHELAVQRQVETAAAAAGQGEEEDEEARKVQATTANFLGAVNDMLRSSRYDVLDVAARRVQDLLSFDNLFKGEDFLQVIDWFGKFLSMGEAFVGGPTELRPQVMTACARFLPAYHRSNLESLTTCLNNEGWQDVAAVTGQAGAVTLELDTSIRASPFYMPGWGDREAITSFEKWMTEGNPFRRGQYAEPEGRQKTLVDLLHKTQTEGKDLSRNASQQSGLAEAGGGDSAAGDEGGGEAAAAAAGTSEAGGDAAADRGAAGPPGPSGAGAQESGQPGGPRTTAMLTISSQQALKYMKHYGQIMQPLSGHSEYLFRCLAELFDVYLLFCFSAFGGMGLEDLVWRDDVLSARLKGALLRILTAEGSKYRPLVEELARSRPGGRGAPIAATGLGLLDRFGDRMESLADSVERGVNRMAVKLSDTRLAQAMGSAADGSVSSGGVQVSGASMVGVPQMSSSSSSGMLTPVAQRGGSSSGGAGGGGGEGSQGGSPTGGSPGGGRQWGLRERVVAVESLMYMAQELKAAKQAIILALPGRCARDVEAYFNRTVEAAADLREYLFKAAARVMMQGVWDGDRGIPAAIAVTNYNVKEAAVGESPWVKFTLRALQMFREKVLSAHLPPQLVVCLWEVGAGVVAAGLLDGLAGVRRCTLEGRANMSLDVAAVERQMRAMGPPGFRPASIASVDAYVKAFYLPWDELPRWCQSRIVEYGKVRLFTLVEVAAEFNKVRRGQKNDALELIEAAEAARF